jgi:hypothetical protein
MELGSGNAATHGSEDRAGLGSSGSKSMAMHGSEELGSKSMAIHGSDFATKSETPTASRSMKLRPYEARVYKIQL